MRGVSSPELPAEIQLQCFDGLRCKYCVAIMVMKSEMACDKKMFPIKPDARYNFNEQQVQGDGTIRARDYDRRKRLCLRIKRF